MTFGSSAELKLYLDLMQNQKCKAGMTWVLYVTSEHLTHKPSEGISTNSRYTLVSVHSWQMSFLQRIDR